jgi:ABC-type phosphate/phosphonate transport system substrate-binding protein
MSCGVQCVGDGPLASLYEEVDMTRYLFSAATVIALAAASRADDKNVYRIGIPKSMFRDVPQALVAFAGQPFQDWMKEQTGFDGEIIQESEAMNVARMVDEGKLHMGVLHGHEFAWAQEKYPSLQPLIRSVYRPKEIQAVLLVRYDCTATHLGELKSRKLAMATTVKDHARLFLEKRRAAEMDGDTFSTIKAESVHEAIQKVMEGEADLTVADHASWNYFQKLYPGPSKNLKELARSEEFPPTVLVYKKGALDDAVLKQIRDGFLTAHKNSKAARLMAVIRIERFDVVPDGYKDAVKACLKAYPKPLEDK